MRKIYISLLSLFTFFFWSTRSTAQVSTYIFSQSSGTFTAITGGTVVATATANAGAAAMDDVNYTLPAATIPFTFTFNGVGYTTLNINSNGYLTFGATLPPAGSPYTPISDNTGYAGAVAAWGGDIISLFNIASTTGEIRYEVVGAAPNREFVVQWTNFRPSYSTSTTSAFVFDFQIRLSETSNTIKIVYGGTLGYIIGSTSYSATRQIGLRGASNADFNNRTNTAGAAFSASVAGTLNTSGQAFNTVTSPPGMPPTGLTYMWAPPSCLAPSGVTMSAITTNSATISWTASSSSPSGGYEWEVRTSGAPGSGAGGLAASGATAAGVITANATGLVGATTYSAYVRSVCTAGSEFSGWTAATNFVTLCTVTTIPYTQDFESAVVPAIPNCTSVETISGNPWTVQNNPGSGFTSKTLRYNYNTAQAANAWFYTQGLILTGGVSYRLTYRYGNNSTFFIERMKVAYGSSATSASMTTTLADHPSIVGGVPATNVIDFTPSVTGGYFIGFQCYSLADEFYLFVDDITVTLTPTCEAPSNLGISASTPTSATLTWNASTSNPPGGYEWEVRTSGAGGSGAAGLVASGTTGAGVTTANATGLTGNTNYNLYVRSNCGGGDLSTWAGGFGFTTPCNATNIPYTQDFESATVPAIPNCTSIQTLSGNPWTVQNSPGSGFTTKTLRYNYNSAQAANAWFYTQGLNLTAGVSYRVTYRYGNNSTFYVESLKVAYGTAAVSSSMTSTIADHSSVTGGTPTTNVVDFTPASTGVYYIGFQSYSTADQFYLFVDDITVTLTPSCEAPTGLSVSALTTTTATVSWTASISNPSNGYQWEVRTSGAGGSGAAGLAASGTTAAGLTSANATGLTPNTTYNLYVRSDCGVSNFSTWAGGYVFVSPCNAITTFPYTQTFEAADPTRSCWKVNEYAIGTVDWIYATAGNGGTLTTAHGGTLNARFYQGNYNNNTTKLVSPALNLSSMTNGAVVRFWHAQEVWLGDQDELRVYYKTSAAGPWTLVPGAVFTSSIAQWTEEEFVLPFSTTAADYYVAFEGFASFGRGVLIDDVTIEAAPTCPKPTAVSAVGVSPTSAIVSFTSPGSAFVVEYGLPGFTPGTTNTPGPGGTVVFGASSPITVGPPGNALTPNTTYDFYVRRICVPGVDYSVNVKATATTLCNATNIPYLQDFETATPTAGFPTCTSMQDVNGNSGPDGNVTGGRWTTFTGTSNQTYVSPTKVLRYLYDAANPARGADDWFYLQGLNLTGGSSYRLKFYFKASDGPVFVERLEVKYGTQAYSSAMTNLLYTNNNIASAIASPWDSATVDFTPVATGVYYIGFHAMSLPDEAFLYIDDVSVKTAPLVDVGVSGLTLPSLTCPTNNVFVQATVKNYNTSVQNFATYPVTVTANITGAATATLTALINTGTLAPGASMNVYLSPSFNFSVGGIYNITTATSTTPASNDPETGNDSYSTSINVNPNPATPVITPPSAAICVGTPVQLSTQFTASPPPVTLPAVTSGTISVAIPDATPAGTSHTLAVTTVPAGGVVTGISVTINATHTWNSDLIFNLKGPNGNVLNLVNRRGGSGDDFVNCIISSTGTAILPAGNTTPITGTFAADGVAGIGPTAFVSNTPGFGGLYSIGNGSWTLAVNDNAGADVGTLTGWSITITYQLVTPTITWAPVAGLYTNAGATTAYSGGNAFSLYANPAATTTYTVTATTAAGCTASASTTVTVNPYPVVTLGSLPDTVCTSDPMIPLTATPVGGSWTGIGVSGNNFIPPATAVGTYALTYSYTTSFGCTRTAAKSIAVKDCPERIILLRDNALILYPNPNNGQFNIRINSVLYNNLSMRVYSNSGVLVRSQEFGGLAWGRVVPIDLTNLPGGAYMVQFYYQGGARTSEKTFKVIIGHE